jgi:hypothetical protein
MLKKIKELLGFPTDAEKAAAKPDAPKQFVDGHGDVREAVAAAQNVFAFPKGDKPEVAEEVKPKAKRTPKPKAETATKAPAKKPAAKKPAAKKPAAKKASTPRKPRQAKVQ